MVDDNLLLAVVVIPCTILFLEAGSMFLSPNQMSQGYSINRKERKGCQARVHHNRCIIMYGRNSQYKITVPITNTSSNDPFITTFTRLQELQALMA